MNDDASRLLGCFSVFSLYAEKTPAIVEWNSTDGNAGGSSEKGIGRAVRDEKARERRTMPKAGTVEIKEALEKIAELRRATDSVESMLLKAAEIGVNSFTIVGEAQVNRATYSMLQFKKTLGAYLLSEHVDALLAPASPGKPAPKGAKKATIKK